MTLPTSIRETLEVHWPKQFRADPDDTQTMQRVFARSLESFARNVRRIMDNGVSAHQIEVCLDQISNEPKYRLMDRGQILKRLWTLVETRKRDRVPEVEVGRRPGERDPGSGILPPDAWPMRAIREAKGNEEQAIAACPMLGRPATLHGEIRYARAIDMPFYADECRVARGQKRRHIEEPRSASELREQADRFKSVRSH
jgi:hypothetical protein